jgi:predicted negative regulator of RcsB-dependent stress response
MPPGNFIFDLTFALLFAAIGTSCNSKKQSDSDSRTAAKNLFEQVTRDFHIPSADAKGAEKARLQEQAAAGYEVLLKKYPEQAFYAAQAERSLGNIRAVQGKIDEAVQHYAAVEKKYSTQEWEVIMSLKSAADLLWENGSKDQARGYYQKIVSRFDQPDASSIIKTVVNGSKRRLAGQELPGEAK